MPDGSQHDNRTREPNGRLRKPERIGRQRQALLLHLSCVPYREIADVLGVSVATAHADVEEAMKDAVPIDADRVAEARRRQLARLGELMRRWFPKAIAGDRDATDVVLRLFDRESRILGLEAPARLNVGLEDVPEKIASLLARVTVPRLGNGDDERDGERQEGDDEPPAPRVHRPRLYTERG